MLISKTRKPDERAYLYRLSHPLGEYVLDSGIEQKTPPAEIIFNISQHPVKISVVEDLCGEGGYLVLSKLSVKSYELEEYLLFNAFTDRGRVLDQETCEKLFQCRGKVLNNVKLDKNIEIRLKKEAERYSRGILSASLENNNRYFQAERERLAKWADDMVLAAEKELRETKEKIKILKRQVRTATSIEEQLQYEKKLQEMNKLLRRQRQRIFDVEDEIMEKRDDLIDELEKKMVQKTHHKILFMIRFKVI